MIPCNKNIKKIKANIPGKSGPPIQLKKIVKLSSNDSPFSFSKKLVNYFNGDFAKSKIEKDLNNYLKKIKKDKKYFISKKDIMLIESIKSDGIQISLFFPFTQFDKLIQTSLNFSFSQM